MKPTVGRIVIYEIDAPDAVAMNVAMHEHERSRAAQATERWRPWAPHTQPLTGDQLPAVVVAVNGDESVALQVLLNGPGHALYVASCTEGTTPGTWHWPYREGE